MKPKSTPSVSQAIKVTIEGKTFEMSRKEAEKLHDSLKEVLNIPTPFSFPYPVVIEKPVYVPHHRPYWERDYGTWCGTSLDQAAQCSGVNRVYLEG